MPPSAADHVVDRLGSGLGGCATEIEPILRTNGAELDVPAILARTFGRAAAPSRPDGVDGVGAIVASLAGHVRLRLAAVGADRSVDPGALVLAGDLLHVDAYDRLATADLADDRRSRCYRVLTDASGTIARRLSAIDVDGREPPSGRGPWTALAAAGCVLGASAAGAPPAVTSGARAYGRLVIRLLAAVDRRRTDAYEAVRAVLVGRGDGRFVRRVDDSRGPVDRQPANAGGRADLERARDGLEALSPSLARSHLERALALVRGVGGEPA